MAPRMDMQSNPTAELTGPQQQQLLLLLPLQQHLMAQILPDSAQLRIHSSSKDTRIKNGCLKTKPSTMLLGFHK